MHHFLVDGRNDDIKSTAEKVPTIREYMNSLPDTAATFRMKNAVDNPQQIDWTEEEIFYFIGTWPAPEKQQSTHATTFVNPNHVHIDHYSIGSVECECGETVDSFRNMHVCTEFDDVVRRRQKLWFDKIVFLSWLGWNVSDVATLLGTARATITDFLNELDMGYVPLKRRYYRSAVDTHDMLLDAGVDKELIQDVYGVSASSISQWRNK